MFYIKLQKYNLPNKKSGYINKRKYSIRFPSNRKLLFNSKRAIEEFVGKTEKELNLIVHELVEIHCKQISEYWDIFLLGNDTDDIPLIIERNNILFKNLKNNIDGPNGNYIIFKFIGNLIDNMLSISTKTTLSYKPNNKNVKFRNNLIIMNRIKNLKSNLDNIGK